MTGPRQVIPKFGQEQDDIFSDLNLYSNIWKDSGADGTEWFAPKELSVTCASFPVQIVYGYEREDCQSCFLIMQLKSLEIKVAIKMSWNFKVTKDPRTLVGNELTRKDWLFKIMNIIFASADILTSFAYFPFWKKGKLYFEDQWSGKKNGEKNHVSLQKSQFCGKLSHVCRQCYTYVENMRVDSVWSSVDTGSLRSVAAGDLQSPSEGVSNVTMVTMTRGGASWLLGNLINPPLKMWRNWIVKVKGALFTLEHLNYHEL